MGSSYTPPALRPEASQNPKWVGLQQTISAICVGRAVVCTASDRQSVISRWNYGNIQARSTPPPGPERVGFGRGVPTPLVPQGEWSGDSPPRALGPSSPYSIVSPVCPPGSGVHSACALGGRLFLPLCQSPTPVLHRCRSRHPILTGVSLRSLGIWNLAVVMGRST